MMPKMICSPRILWSLVGYILLVETASLAIRLRLLLLDLVILQLMLTVL